jgi:ATP-dependent Lon protease
MDRPIAPGFAMTGELSLTGRVLPIGGVKEKAIAARRDGVSQIILPSANRKDWTELPDVIKEDLTVHFVSDYDEVFELCFPSA